MDTVAGATLLLLLALRVCWLSVQPVLAEAAQAWGSNTYSIASTAGAAAAAICQASTICFHG